MAVSGVNSGSNYVSQVQPQPQTYVERVKEKPNDNGKEAGVKSVAAPQEAPKPTVNVQGQTVGSVINVKA
jgi:hypothetical protein